MSWSYKTVRFDMKKDGILGSAFLDEDEIELTLNEFGKVGWELISFIEVQEGLLAVFKMYNETFVTINRAEIAAEETRKDSVDARVPLAEEGDEPIVPETVAQSVEKKSTNIVDEQEKPDDTDVGAIRIE